MIRARTLSFKALKAFFFVLFVFMILSLSIGSEGIAGV